MTQPNPLKGYLLVQKKFDREIFAILRRVSQDLQRRIALLSSSVRFSDSVRASQLRVVLSEIRKEQIRMMQSMGPVIRRGQLTAELLAIEDLAKLERVIFSSLPAGAAGDVLESLRFTARSGLKSLYARVPRELSASLYDAAAWSAGKIENIIRSGIATGSSAKEIAKDVARFVSPTAPGGVSFVSMRLARTEINNAFHQRQIAGMDAPGVSGARWNLSGSHPRPDECNRLAQTDQYSMGVGVFPRGKVPGKPHPQCLCYLTYVTMTPQQFASAVRAGDFDDELRKRFQANLVALKG